MADGTGFETGIDKDGEQKSIEAFSYHDLMDQLCQSVPEDARQVFVEKVATDAMKLAETLGAESRAVVETASTPFTAIVISSGTEAITDQISRRMLEPGKRMARWAYSYTL